MAKDTALIAGNGVSLDAAGHAGIRLDSSHPWALPVAIPGAASFAGAFPSLAAHLQAQGDPSTWDAYACSSAVALFESDPPRVGAGARSQVARTNDRVLLEARHFLALAFAWYRAQVQQAKLDHWRWAKWLRQKSPRLAAVTSYNYDTILEDTMEAVGIGFQHIGTSMTDAHWRPATIGPTSSPIPLIKLHGSVSYKSLDTRIHEYPLPVGLEVHAMLPLKLMTRKDDHLKGRHVADLVLPGQKPFDWGLRPEELPGEEFPTAARRRALREACRGVTDLYIAGFSCGEPDRAEFVELCRLYPSVEQVLVVNRGQIPATLKLALDEAFPGVTSVALDDPRG